MKTGILVGLITLFIASTLWAVEITDLSERSTLNVARSQASIVIDGVISPEEWNKAETGTLEYDVFVEGRKIAHSTYVRLLWDEKYLYVSFECVDDDIKSTFINHDDPVYEQEECVEIFIDPEGKGRHYYEIDYGPAGAAIDLMIPLASMISGPKNRSYDIQGLLHAVKIYGTLNDSSDRDEKWTVETAIPWSDFRGRKVSIPPRDGDSWRINFFRIDQPDALEKKSRYVSWSKSKAIFHEPKNFGEIVFLK